MTDKKLICIITGIERSGTTILSKTIASHPDIYSGWECGVLLNDINNFNKIVPFYDWIVQSNENWGLSCNTRDNILMNCSSYQDIYNILYTHMGECSNRLDIFKQTKYIYDKTPAYIYNLYNILLKLKNETIFKGLPIFICYKNYDAIIYSYIKRNRSLDTILNRINSYITNINNIISNKLLLSYFQIYFINYENYINNYDNINNSINIILSKYILSYNTSCKLHIDKYINKLINYNIDLSTNIDYISNKYNNSTYLKSINTNILLDNNIKNIKYIKQQIKYNNLINKLKIMNKIL